jgi:hypothetical protein
MTTTRTHIPTVTLTEELKQLCRFTGFTLEKIDETHLLRLILDGIDRPEWHGCMRSWLNDLHRQDPESAQIIKWAMALSGDYLGDTLRERLEGFARSNCRTNVSYPKLNRQLDQAIAKLVRALLNAHPTSVAKFMAGRMPIGSRVQNTLTGTAEQTRQLIAHLSTQREQAQLAVDSLSKGIDALTEHLTRF